MLRKRLLFAVAGEAEQQLEDVDEVQVERECAKDGKLLLAFLVKVFGILLLDVLVSQAVRPTNTKIPITETAN